MSYNILRRRDFAGGMEDPALVPTIRADLHADGWTLLRGFAPNMRDFTRLVGRLCARVTFDPARSFSSDKTQMVDAGLGPIGLHIENGNTPRSPDVVAFFAERAAFEGSQTTICDGAQFYADMDDELQRRWSSPMTVERLLPEPRWKRYLANEHPAISHPDEVRMEHILQFQQAIPGQSFELHDDGSLTYRLTVEPVRRSAFGCAELAFANSVLGPSHNYEPPRYTLADGSAVTADEIEALRGLAEDHTHEINWQDGDIAVLDNTRVMHGRRAIADAERTLFVGMGSV